jgi:hypothetical protein
VLAVAQAADLLLEQALQALLALNEWQLRRAFTVQVQKIESKEHELIGTAFIHRRLEPAAAAPAELAALAAVEAPTPALECELP